MIQKLFFLFLLVIPLLNTQKGWAQSKEYDFQINETGIPFLLPYGYEPVLTVKLDKDLEPDKKYEVTFLVNAKKNEKYARYAYDLWVFPANRMERTVDEDRRLSTSNEIIPRVSIDELQYYEKRFLTFTVSPDTIYSYLTIGVEQEQYSNFSIRDYVKVSGVFVWPLANNVTETKIERDQKGTERIEPQKIITDRELIDKGETFNVNTAEVEIALYDHRRIDGDIVTIYLNDEIIVDKLKLIRKKKRYKAKLKPGANTIILHAENLGDVPPNTAAIEILGGKQKIEQVLKSDLNHSEFFTIYYDINTKK